MKFFNENKWLAFQLILLFLIEYFLKYKPHFTYRPVVHIGPIPSTFFVDVLAIISFGIIFIVCLMGLIISFQKRKRLHCL
jgi:hypothetical protein